jgi:hypothetical protein
MPRRRICNLVTSRSLFGVWTSAFGSTRPDHANDAPLTVLDTARCSQYRYRRNLQFTCVGLESATDRADFFLHIWNSLPHDAQLTGRLDLQVFFGLYRNDFGSRVWEPECEADDVVQARTVTVPITKRRSCACHGRHAPASQAGALRRQMIARRGGGGGWCLRPQGDCPSKIPSFLARWRVRGPAGTGSVGRGEGAPDPAPVARHYPRGQMDNE